MANIRPAHVHQHADEAAQKIGALYREGRQHYINAGRLLRQKKSSMPHGYWLSWLEANQEALGFGERTARRLILWADCPDLEPEDVWQSGEHSNRSRASDLIAEPSADNPKTHYVTVVRTPATATIVNPCYAKAERPKNDEPEPNEPKPADNVVSRAWRQASQHERLEFVRAHRAAIAFLALLVDHEAPEDVPARPALTVVADS